ncbi:MAG: YdbH domain-containing protein [Hyphomonadaceae bacterium]
MSTALVGLGVWLTRLSLAEFMIGAALAERGAEADFDVTRLDLGGATLENLRFGSETSPDALIPRVEATWGWSGLLPRLELVRLERPRLRLRMDQGGRISAGSLDQLGRGGGASPSRPALPRLALQIADGEATIEAPFGVLSATLEANGTIGRDFSAVARIAETSTRNGGYGLERAAGELVIASQADAISLRLDLNAAGVTWDGARANDGSLRLTARAPLDLATYEADAALRIASLSAPDLEARGVVGAAGVEAAAQDNSIEPATWRAEARLRADSFTAADATMQAPRFDARADGAAARGRVSWTIGGERFAGFALISDAPAITGEAVFELRGDETVRGQALLRLAQARLNDAAQQDLRAAFPNLDGAPVGPTLASAEAALDRAADRFDLSAPLVFDGDEAGFRVRVSAPMEARAASGAVLRVAPLRQDAPGLVLQWPGPSLHGALAVELAGGGAPQTALLLDNVDWAPEAPFEAEGTLSLSNWRAENASIGADELNVAIAIAPQGGGRVDVRGPVLITGPLGDGEVRDLNAALDLGVVWSAVGWRVAPNACLPVRMGGLDAAGLAFSNGDFALCPLDGALIAADARENLSGGFSIQRLALGGRLSGPEGQPARLSAADVVGRFSGRSGDITLAITAAAPSLSIAMSEERTLALTLARATANAHIGESWRVEGAFERGALEDPALPGGISAIAGHWSAEPTDDGPVIRVAAGEALLTANEPASDKERLLFNPLRLINAGAIVRNGRIDAEGSLLLEARQQQLATFSAYHNIEDGHGVAQIVAPSLAFGPDFQPHDISEQVRDLAVNVRGDAAALADITWTPDAITSSGALRLDGVSMATATIPIVEDVRGTIQFNDLFELTTPPGQQIQVGLINPGVAVRDGRVRFQLLPQQRVAIEGADFAFAGGVLSMQPALIKLGADETRFELTLRDVDAADLLATLNVPDLAVTGRIEGSFPLLLTRRSAFIQNGVLRASPEGGNIAYTGNAGDNATGAARLAFDALRSFRYRSLELRLDGDLSDEIVTSIAFDGVNSGQPVDLGPIAPIPGLGRVTVRGVPFAFNVRVTAPFRRLAQTVTSITDPGAILNREDDAEEPEPVDQPAP